MTRGAGGREGHGRASEGGPSDAEPEARTPGWRRRWRRRLLVALAALAVLPPAAFGVLSLLFPFPLGQFERVREASAAPLVFDREGTLLRAFLADDESWMFWVGTEEVSPRLLSATIAVEDQRFRSHPGVDPLAVARAGWTNAARRRRVSGASTITMQVMRLLWRRPRTVASKAVEAFRALQAEWLLDKDQILEWYLNLAPYGGNLIGVEAAALSYFGKHARDLTLAEAALLAGLPKSPTRLRPDRFPARARARRDFVLERMHACGTITDEQLATALREPLHARRRAFPFEAPHLARLVRGRNPGKATLHTTLDRRAQNVAETAIRKAVAALRGAGVTNGAVVIIENRTAAVRALVGSADFGSVEDAGQVNGAVAPRSPGSALKPFTYALAFERGVATPSTVLADVPANYTGYEPENYDHLYRGPVSARHALAHSLNIPAVRLLEQVGQPALHRFLKQLGLTTLNRPSSHYGLALTLGSVEVTLLELTNAYAALARLGLYRPCRLLETQPRRAGRRVLSEGAAYLVADVLSDTERLAGLAPWRSGKGQRRMAWKTGTSYGHRDAWTVAYTPHYTVGVWLGNFSGRPARGLVGIRSAAPVTARIVDGIHADVPPTWFAMPATVARRPLCAVSGQPLGERCPREAEGLCLVGRSSGRPCSVHARVCIDTATGRSLCPACLSGRGHTTETLECWPENLAAWLRRHQPHRRLAPPHLATCPRAADDGARPQILSPTDGQAYVVAGDEPSSGQKLLLKATSVADVLYWFVDGALVAAVGPSEPTFWPLARGQHTIVCSDDAGRSSAVTISVQ